MAAALAGWWIFKQEFHDGYFDFTYLPYHFAAIDLLKSLLPMVVAALVGLIMLVVIALGQKSLYQTRQSPRYKSRYWWYRTGALGHGLNFYPLLRPLQYSDHHDQ